MIWAALLLGCVLHSCTHYKQTKDVVFKTIQLYATYNWRANLKNLVLQNSQKLSSKCRALGHRNRAQKNYFRVLFPIYSPKGFTLVRTYSNLDTWIRATLSLNMFAINFVSICTQVCFVEILPSGFFTVCRYNPFFALLRLAWRDPERRQHFGPVYSFFEASSASLWISLKRFAWFSNVLQLSSYHSKLRVGFMPGNRSMVSRNITNEVIIFALINKKEVNVSTYTQHATEQKIRTAFAGPAGKSCSLQKLSLGCTKWHRSRCLRND